MAPYHLRKKLENMPHNKGYIFNGAVYFGTADADQYKYDPNDEYLLFQLLNKTTMHITKYNSKEWRVYEKNLVNRKEHLIDQGKIIQFEKKR